MLVTNHSSPVKHSRRKDIRDAKNPQDDQEWETTLRSLLLQEKMPSTKDQTEIVATVTTGSQIHLQIRKNIEGIFQRLGEIDLKYQEDLEIDTISWAHNAVSRADALSAEIQDLKAKDASQGDTIHNLNQQLSDLTNAKKEHESALMAKFCELLNAKKLKIRDQQRLLAGAKVDSAQAAKVQASRAVAERRSPERSRAGKRKASKEEEDDEEENAFANGKGVKKEESEDEEGAQTPEPSDDDTDVTEDEDGESDGGKVEEAARPLNRTKATAAEEKMQSDTPPPSRELPFGKKTETNMAAAAPKAATMARNEPTRDATNDDDETDDDEL